MGKTPDEIKKGLECCTIKDGCMCADCLGCSYYDPNKFNRVCDTSMHNDALAYIQQLESANAELLTTVKQLQKERDAALKQLQGHCWCCKKGKPLREGSSLMICPHFGALRVIAGMRSGCPEWEWNEGKEFEHEQ